MLSPLLNTKSVFPTGPSPEGAEPPESREPGAFARLLSSCLKNPAAQGEAASPRPGAKKSSSEHYSTFALLSLLQGNKADPTKESTDGLLADGILCSPEEGVMSNAEEADAIAILTGITPEHSLEEETEQGMNSPSLLEEAPAGEEGGTTGDPLFAESALVSVEDGTEKVTPPLPQEAEAATSAAAASQVSLSAPVLEKLPVSGKTAAEGKEASPGKVLTADPAASPAPQKEGASLLSTGTLSLPGTGEGTGNKGQKNLPGEASASASEEEGVMPSLSEKELPAVKNQGQENNRKTLEFSSADRDDQKEPQSVRSRDGDSPFSSILRAAGPAEAKGTAAASRGAEVPLSTRNGEALGEGMTNVVRFLRRDGLHRASIVVEPPALGRVEIELSSTAGGVEASIRVGSEQLRQLVQDQLIVLRNSLSQQGIQMTSCTVDIGDSRMDQGENRDTGEREKGYIAQPEKDLTEETLSFRVDLEQGLLYWMA